MRPLLASFAATFALASSTALAEDPAAKAEAPKTEAAAAAPAPPPTPVIPPGKEELLAAMLGKGAQPAGCTLETISLDKTFLRGGYACAEGKAALELRDPGAAPFLAKTAKFTLVGGLPAPGAALVTAIAERVRAREKDFEWLLPVVAGPAPVPPVPVLVEGPPIAGSLSVPAPPKDLPAADLAEYERLTAALGKPREVAMISAAVTLAETVPEATALVIAHALSWKASKEDFSAFAAKTSEQRDNAPLKIATLAATIAYASGPARGVEERIDYYRAAVRLSEGIAAPYGDLPRVRGLLALATHRTHDLPGALDIVTVAAEAVPEDPDLSCLVAEIAAETDLPRSQKALATCIALLGTAKKAGATVDLEVVAKLQKVAVELPKRLARAFEPEPPPPGNPPPGGAPAAADAAVPPGPATAPGVVADPNAAPEERSSTGLIAFGAIALLAGITLLVLQRRRP